MAIRTNKAIIETFEEMLDEMPFEKITVSSLAKRCEISPNTFYYHYEDIYDLLTDFRFGGYRILGDVVCDMEDENTGREKKQLFRESDSEAFTAMMRAFADKSASRSYRDAVTARCRELLTAIVRPALAVRYVVALGRRDLLWDLLPEYIEKNVLEVRDD